ncbi:hypothetical protein D3D02_10260 [Halobellus sp. Atlit-38R]|uniref:hypothetical protein n=1 Tax=Halobellus sp. Atlit-38R TaxID=2282131 RepID=UPI000EF18950|nr:hypothetical protein [Halobellus sp. Atlit-38R]RLM88899.1 hypothetical protein D3D02_10260 [Halobellus sp. Atlit-38R]
MVSAVGLVLFGAVLVVHTLLAAVLTRFFRLRLNTQWGYVVYSFALIPIALLVTTLVFFGILPIGAGLNLGATALLGAAIALPLALGFTIDTLYIPAPEEYDLPDRQ